MSWIVNALCALNLSISPIKDYCAQNHYQKPPPAIQPNFSSNDLFLQPDLTLVSQHLNSFYGYNLSPEDLIYLSRLTYFESGNNGRDSAERRKSLESIVYTIVNRWKFDNEEYVLNDGTVAGYRRFGDGSLMSIVNSQRGRKEFSPIQPNYRFFRECSFKDKEGNYRLSYTSHPEITEQIQESYRAVLTVLTEEREDPTEGALFFKNPWVTGSSGPHIGSHLGARVKRKSKITLYQQFYLTLSVRIGAHQFYSVIKKERKK